MLESINETYEPSPKITRLGTPFAARMSPIE